MACLAVCSNFEILPDGKTVKLHCCGRTIEYDHIVDFYKDSDVDGDRLRTDADYARNLVESGFRNGPD
jgi:hypothetical protein